MGAMASQITSLTIVYSTVYSGVDQRKHQRSASLLFVWGIHWLPVNSPHKWPVTRKLFPFDDVVMDRFLYVECVVFVWYVLLVTGIIRFEWILLTRLCHNWNTTFNCKTAGWSKNLNSDIISVNDIFSLIHSWWWLEFLTCCKFKYVSILMAASLNLMLLVI